MKTKGMRFHPSISKQVLQKLRPKKKQKSVINPSILNLSKADKKRLLEYLTDIKIAEKSIEHSSVKVELTLDEMLDKYFQDNPEIQKISAILKNRK